MAILAKRVGDVPICREFPPLENGAHLDQKTFHARYEAMPPDTNAELIGGIVYVASHVRCTHGQQSGKVCAWLVNHESETPGVEALAHTTVILSDSSELQPDVTLLISPEYGGQTGVENDYIVGAPELVVEVASATESYNLHLKLKDYERAGVREYVVVVLWPQRVLWFVNRGGRFETVDAGADQLYRSETFPGLWLDPAALLRLDSKALRAALELGLATPEHQEFVQCLAAAREAKG